MELETKTIKFMKEKKMVRPETWFETYYEIVSAIEQERLKAPVTNLLINEINENQGSSGFKQLAINLTDEFDKIYDKDYWFEHDYYETIDKFMDKKFNPEKYFEFEIYKTYKFSTIEDYTEKNQMNIIEHGENLIGEDFIIIKDSKNKTISFVLTGTQGDDYLYQCIYKD